MTFLAVCFLQTSTIGYLILVNILFFLPDKRINILYFRTILGMSMLWIIYLIFGILFNISYDIQLDFILKVLIMIQMSVFLLKSISMDIFLEDTRLFLECKWYQKMVYFIYYFNFIYIKIINFYKNTKLSELTLSKKLMNVVEVVRDFFENVDTIKAGLPVIDIGMIKECKRRAFCTWGNLYLIILIVVYLMVIVI